MNKNAVEPLLTTSKTRVEIFVALEYEEHKAWIILGAIYIPWAILRGLQKFSGLFSNIERVFSAKIYFPNIC